MLGNSKDNKECYKYMELLSLILGTTGTVLGIVSTILNLDKSRVKLKVIPTHIIGIGLIEKYDMGITIRNLSSFSVVIDQIGFDLSESNFLNIDTVDNTGFKTTLPQKLDPRESYQVFFSKQQLRTQYKLVKPFVRTQCGKKIKGSSPAFRQIKKELNNIR